MVRVVDRIEKTLCDNLAPREFSIIDDSSKHAGHAGAREGGESHFRVRVVSEHFAGKSKVERHRMVYSLMQPLFDEGLHALALETLTPEESGA